MGVDNYARFYALLRRMPCADKETLVSQYSDGRTTHLRELSGSEYRAMCDAMARVAGEDVDAFCRDRRIAGTDFRELDGEGLEALTRKIRIIRRKRQDD